VEFSGTLLLVSHDCEFLDNVVTSTLVFEGDGRIGEYIGGCSDWLALERRRAAAAAWAQPAREEPATVPRPARPRKLTPKEQRELEALPPQIEQLEAEQADLAAKLADPGFYQREPGAGRTVKVRLAAIEHEVAATFARWEELEALRAGVCRTTVFQTPFEKRPGSFFPSDAGMMQPRRRIHEMRRPRRVFCGVRNEGVASPNSTLPSTGHFSVWKILPRVLVAASASEWFSRLYPMTSVCAPGQQCHQVTGVGACLQAILT